MERKTTLYLYPIRGYFMADYTMVDYSVDTQDLIWRINSAFKPLHKCEFLYVEHADTFIPAWIYAVEIAGVKLRLEVNYPDAVLNEEPTTYADIDFRFTTYSDNKYVTTANIGQLDNVVNILYNTPRHFSDPFVDACAPKVTIKPNISNYRSTPEDLHADLDVHMVELYSLVDSNGEHLDPDTVGSIEQADITADLQARFNIPDNLIDALCNYDMLQRCADLASVHILHYDGDTPYTDRVYKQVIDYITL